MVKGKLFSIDNLEELQNSEFFQNTTTFSLIHGMISNNGEWLVCNIEDSSIPCNITCVCTTRDEEFVISSCQPEYEYISLYDACIRMIINRLFSKYVNKRVIIVNVKDCVLVKACRLIGGFHLENTKNYTKYSVIQNEFYEKNC